MDADGGAYPAVRGALNKLGSFEDIVAEGIAQPQGAAVALLYSESSDIWFSSVGTIGAGLRSMYLAFRHAGLPVQVFTEDDCAAGRLFHTDLLVVAVPNVAESAAQAIAEWVRAGGAVLATAGGGQLNEYNETATAMPALLGVEQHGMWRGTQDSVNGTVDLIKQDLRFVDTLDEVELTDATAKEAGLGRDANRTMVCKGFKSVFALNGSAGSDVLATFGDGSPAATRRVVGHGKAYYHAFLPGLAYFDSAIPLRPVDRGSTDDNFNHFIPTDFTAAARHLLTLPLVHKLEDASVVPVRGSSPLVEIGLIAAAGRGFALPCINWHGRTIQNFTVTLASSIKFEHAFLASGRPLAVSADRLSFSFELCATADALVLRTESSEVALKSDELPGPFPPNSSAAKHMRNVVLAYTPGPFPYFMQGFPPNAWAPEMFESLLAYQSADRTSTVDELFDSVWIVGNGVNGKSFTPPRDKWMNNSLSLNQSDWRDFLKMQLRTARSLENASAAVSSALGRKVSPTVVITLPYPDTRQTAFGQGLNFSRTKDRIAASKWYVDLAVQQWKRTAAAEGWTHLRLVGLYYVFESVCGCINAAQTGCIMCDTESDPAFDGVKLDDAAIIPLIAKHVHSLPDDLLFTWIPYYDKFNSQWAPQWRSLGFDLAVLQPHVAYAGANPALCFGTNDSQKQFDIVANMVSGSHLGVEMEVASYTRNALPEPDEDSVSAAAPFVSSFEEAQRMRLHTVDKQLRAVLAGRAQSFVGKKRPEGVVRRILISRIWLGLPRASKLQLDGQRSQAPPVRRDL